MIGSYVATPPGNKMSISYTAKYPHAVTDRYENTALYAGFHLVRAYIPVAVQVDTGRGYRSNSGC